METCIGAHNKAVYLIEEMKKPAPKDPNFETWNTKNHKVKSWLIDLMSPLLMQQFFHLSTAKEYGRLCQKPSMMDRTKFIFF
ncbi:hypothetical protein Patl1_15598 [Pistacia atlantica]|uniref:Uncharacterized protein n=1 Tax=Pistacia atlantica TaxID=434234 RepID=A0ACC1B7M8_9ROSI|nr:hypothetical protein Patl1_15598 [Pistacia atlantica]